MPKEKTSSLPPGERIAISVVDATMDLFAQEFSRRLKWLIALRAMFGLFLLGSTVAFTRIKKFSAAADPLILLYFLSAFILLLSLAYAILMLFIKRKKLFTFVQLIMDTFIVTTIIFITGSFSSVFSFLYLIVVISACFFLLRKGGMIIAALCSIQYGLMIDLEYYGILRPFEMAHIFGVASYSGPHILYKMIVTILACFVVAFLTSLLVEQEQRAKKELWAMRKHVDRVERMAAIGEMAAGLAHEIKNPLAALTGAIEMLNSELTFFDPDGARLMGIVKRETKRLNTLVTNFLLFARPQRGKAQSVLLDRVIRDTLDLFEKGINEDWIVCRSVLAPNIWVDVDPEYLRQILWNLLLNAADAIRDSGRKEGVITVTTASARDHLAAIEVADNGCGMPESDMDAIFNPFFTTKPKGTGLGLSVVHRLVEAYGGRIDVESLQGQGSRFSLFLEKVPAPLDQPTALET
ncbi:two-component system sensor histidine kinase NtrB [Desulfosudis oleivorans]|nr:ATP-binding protein [Desulfosudis oleivorans]